MGGAGRWIIWAVGWSSAYREEMREIIDAWTDVLLGQYRTGSACGVSYIYLRTQMAYKIM